MTNRLRLLRIMAMGLIAGAMLLVMPSRARADCQVPDTCSYDLFTCDQHAAQDCYSPNCANAEVFNEQCYYAPDPDNPSNQCYTGYSCQYTCQDAGGCGGGGGICETDPCWDGECHAGFCSSCGSCE
jgi:hypothetical protein